MTTHTITLARHTAQVVGLMGVLVLGTWDSYGTEQLLLRHGPEWEGLAIDATFHNVPNDKGVTMLVDADGLVPVPPEACMRASKYATITFRGVQDGVQRISCNLPYMVLDHAQVPGANSTATPSEIAQALAQMQGLRDGAVDAKNQAEAARADVANSATAAAASEKAAASSAVAAAGSAAQAEAQKTAAASSATAAAASATAAAGNAKTASDAAAEATDAKAAAVAAQKDAAASKAAAANSSAAAKTSEDAAAKSAADAGSTANSINNSMMQIAANKEAVSQLKEDMGDLENLKYRELYYNLFYDFFAIATNKSGNMTEYGNAQHIFIENVYSNGVKLESGNYLVALKLTNISLKRQVNVDARFRLCIIDGWNKKYLGDIQYYNGEKELFVYSVINFTNDNNIKVSPALILDTGFEPNSEYSFDVDTIAIIKNNTNGLPESIFHYGNNKIYPVFDMYSNLSNFKNAYILNKKLVANDTSGTSDISAQYTVAKMGNTVNKIMLKGIFDTNTTIAIITEPNGMTNVTDVTNRSIHVTFSANGCSVGYFDNKALTNIKNISWDGDYIGKEVTIGFEISGNTITVYLPNGNTLTVTNEKLVSCGGKYALWEHYIGALNKRIFHSAQFTKIYAEDADGNILCDDFNRENGSIGIAPQGYVYAQFTNENQTGWSF